MISLTFPPVAMPPNEEELRREVRTFIRDNAPKYAHIDAIGSFGKHDPEFSRAVGRKGWIGMTWPKRYGGGERSQLERLIVCEEFYATGAPVGAHWPADRQSGPAILRFGTEEQKERVLPRIAAGDCYISVGMSEPNSGSDLASVRTRATKVPGGFLANGQKIWTSVVHKSHYLILFCRTADQTDDRHAGFSQFLVDLKEADIEIRPIINLVGEHSFNEVFFKDTFFPDSALLGTLNDGWNQVMSELASERTGPERFMSTYALLRELVDYIGPNPSEQIATEIGRLIAHLMVLRRMCYSVLGNGGPDAALQASLVKDMGATLEQEVPELIRRLIEAEPDPEATQPFLLALARTVLFAPSFSIRGGAREILRGIVAKGLGLR